MFSPGYVQLKNGFLKDNQSYDHKNKDSILYVHYFDYPLLLEKLKYHDQNWDILKNHLLEYVSLRKLYLNIKKQLL